MGTFPRPPSPVGRAVVAVAAFVMLLSTAAARADTPPPGRKTRNIDAGVSVRNARVRWLPGDLPLAGYMTLSNHTQTTLHLVGATSPAFKEVMLHRSTHSQGMAHMEHVDGVSIPPGAAVAFAPGGYHLMLMHRTRAIRVGDRLPITLRFAARRRLSVRFRVESAEGR